MLVGCTIWGSLQRGSFNTVGLLQDTVLWSECSGGGVTCLCTRMRLASWAGGQLPDAPGVALLYECRGALGHVRGGLWSQEEEI